MSSFTGRKKSYLYEKPLPDFVPIDSKSVAVVTPTPWRMRHLTESSTRVVTPTNESYNNKDDKRYRGEALIYTNNVMETIVRMKCPTDCKVHKHVYLVKLDDVLENMKQIRQKQTEDDEINFSLLITVRFSKDGRRYTFEENVQKKTGWVRPHPNIFFRINDSNDSNDLHTCEYNNRNINYENLQQMKNRNVFIICPSITNGGLQINMSETAKVGEHPTTIHRWGLDTVKRGLLEECGIEFDDTKDNIEEIIRNEVQINKNKNKKIVSSHIINMNK